MDKIGIGSSCGKIILMGEHAVVYGEPAIAIPFKALKVKTTVSNSLGPIRLNCRFYRGDLCHAGPHLEGLMTVIKETLHYLKQEEKDLSITIESQIPEGRGMGSSAAVSVAIIRALFDYFKAPLSNDLLLKLVQLSEVILHGNPSGLDALVTSGNHPLFYIKGQPLNPFHLNINASLIVADTGVTGKTIEAVSKVGDLVRQSPEQTKKYIQELGDLTKEAKGSLENNEPILLGKLMTSAHHLLNLIGVSHEALNHLVDIANKEGAQGAKLTGGGLGGCMIALTNTKEMSKHISNKLIEAGAKSTWIYHLGSESSE